MKQQQPGLITNIVTTLVAWSLTAAILLVAESVRRILWPLACFIAKSAWKGIRHLVAKKSKVAKSSKPSALLPTPEIFKDAPNLGPAKEFRF